MPQPLLLSLLLTCCTSTAAYVADCDADPLAALAKARDTIRSSRHDPSQLATVTVRGTCRLSAPLQLDGPQDSNIRWEGGTISGGVAVSGWEKEFEAPCAGCGSVWTAHLKIGTAAARQLWVSGVRANRTQMRFPQGSGVKTDTGINTTIGANWSRAEAIEMVYAGHDYCLGAQLKAPSSPNFFTWQRLPVTAVTPSEIMLSATALSHIPLVPKQAELGLPCWVENVFELLGDNATGRAGDYYHDVPAQKLYFVSPVAPTEVVLPQTAALITLTNATGVTFVNTTFSETTWLFGEDGYTQIQAGCVNRKDRLVRRDLLLLLLLIFLCFRSFMLCID